MLVGDVEFIGSELVILTISVYTPAMNVEE
jgi:hypothetical protein